MYQFGPMTLADKSLGDESIPQKVASTDWVVQKFGGTSLGKFPELVAEIVKYDVPNKRKAVVCSARSCASKSEGTTARLLKAATIAGDPYRAGAKDEILILVQLIQDDHVNAASATIKSPELLDAYKAVVEAECQSLVKVLESVHHIEELSPRAENKIISKGEKLACQFLVALLQDRGVAAQYVDLSDVVRRYDVPAATLENVLYRDLANAFRQEVNACGDSIPVITGYFGDLPAGLLMAVGRGYTDLAAALVAIGTSARELQIWKEIDGVYSADPSKVPTASLLPSISPSEAAELTYFGSEVIHPHTMEQVMQAEIPIRIKNVMKPERSGTVIVPGPAGTSAGMISQRCGLTLSRGRSSADLTSLKMPKRPTAVTVKRSVTVISLCSNKMTRAHGFLSRIFQILDTHHLSIDLIASSEVHVSLALHSERPLVSSGAESSTDSDDESLSIEDGRLRGACEDLKELGSVDIVTDMAIISLVGQNLKNMVGISGKFFKVLGDHNINIEMISQGASEINISCVIWERDADRALNIVHTNLFTFLE